jgi:murein DD-endopeptidase MepM/ murein hydrolase activator NlpD
VSLRPIGRRRFLASMAGLGWVLAGCGTDEEPAGSTPTTTAVPPSASPPPATMTPTRGPTIEASASPTAAPSSPTTTADAVANEPRGFPLEPSTRCGLVIGVAGARSIAWGEGPSAEAYSRDDQPSDDPELANRCGWNARTHVEYEARPAVDWYLPDGTPVIATMDGVATLLIYTTANPFEVYGVDREPYLGNPDRARAPLSPFPGPGGGQGVAVHIENELFRTEYAHLDVVRTVEAVPAAAYLDGYAASTDYMREFSALRPFGVSTAIARWPVRRGDVIGFSGDTGYSEAPHLHYVVARLPSDVRLSPTNEPGFEDAGWLFK